MIGQYILDTDGKTPVACGDKDTWGKWMQNTQRHVADTNFTDELGNKVRVSTVFLGLDHCYGEGRPLLFETMIFGGYHDQYQERCSTWAEAESMHIKALNMVQPRITPAFAEKKP